MEQPVIGVVVVATNAYFVLGIRFIKKFMHHYTGSARIIFYFFSDTDPSLFLPSSIDCKYIHTEHKNWTDGTNSKFTNIISLEDESCDYLFYFDADTNVGRPFDESWFIGDLVAGEHYGNPTWMTEISKKPFERRAISKAYVPMDSPRKQVYCYGAFFGGKKNNMISMCQTLAENQRIDKLINFEPCWNDESYLNHYFHYNDPKIIPCKNFIFSVSDKGGIGETRNPGLDISTIKEQMMRHKNETYDIVKDKVVII